jgi:hypothetical protein
MCRAFLFSMPCLSLCALRCARRNGQDIGERTHEPLVATAAAANVAA